MAIAKGSRAESCISLVVGGGAGFGLIVLTARAWKACGVDVGGVGNGPTLLFVGVPVAAVVNIVLFTMVFRLSRSGKSGGKFFSPFLAAVIAITIADLALFSWQGTPAASHGICPGNVPPWWPAWIPT
jgi:hypothetical protein